MNWIEKVNSILYVKFDELISRLSDVHPVRYMSFNNTVDAIFIENLRKFTDDEYNDIVKTFDDTREELNKRIANTEKIGKSEG